ncbi:hypothetical protein SSSM5_069 [Synechococcus phage S-SSM5]|uniref:Uncharacterized protein n=1 Tax=Synechococcus phage S-SSM5 TaxID=445685 RepID=E3SKA9_9CAUD|nr:hypothetical protein SSSM5_069 [Synechococcus phage S-SSM5]ADO98001.1 hypothetical protein SSSM5_069 [Synechococcus phage S-SSM5]
MTDKKNIEDVTDSPEDWDDFWFNEDLGLSYSMSEDDIEELMKERPEFSNPSINANYVQDVINGENVFRRPNSPLSD